MRKFLAMGIQRHPHCQNRAVNAFVRYAVNYSSNGLLEIQWYLFLAIFLIPQASLLIFAPALFLTDIAGLPREMIQAGWDAFRFWRS